MQQARLEKHLDKLSQDELMDLFKKQAMSLHKAYIQKIVASNKEFNHKGDRGGRFNAKNATLHSRSYNSARIYDSLLEDFKIIFKKI